MNSRMHRWWKNMLFAPIWWIYPVWRTLAADTAGITANHITC